MPPPVPLRLDLHLSLPPEEMLAFTQQLFSFGKAKVSSMQDGTTLRVLAQWPEKQKPAVLAFIDKWNREHPNQTITASDWPRTQLP